MKFTSKFLAGRRVLIKLVSGGRLFGLVAMVLMLIIRVTDPTPLQIARAKLFDWYQVMKPRETPPERPAMIVDLDEASLAEFGQWPWPRTLLARLIDNLTAAGAAGIGFDIVFAEPDRLSPAALSRDIEGLDPESRNRLAALPSNDAVMAAALKRSRVVVGSAGVPVAGRDQTRLKRAPTVALIGGKPQPWLDYYPDLLRNIETIDSAAAGWGVFSVSPEADGVVRRVPAAVTDGSQIYPAMALELLRLATGNESLGVKMSPDGVAGVIVKPNLVATDAHGRIWLYASRHDPEKYISAAAVIRGAFDPERVNGRLVLVGTSAAGLQDIRTTAVEPHIPGVELHTQIIETILNGMQLAYPADAPAVEWVAAMVGALLMIALIPWIGARWTLLLLIAAVGGLCAYSWHEFAARRLLYDTIFPVATTVLVFIVTTYGSYMREEQSKRQVRSAFGRYMSPVLVERLAADPSLLKLGGEKRDMTLLFCDVRGFTSISEQYDAEGLTHLINRFLTPMTELILSHKGTIDKYMGDCIMAFWNAPLDDPDHAANACRAALRMNEALTPLNEALEAEAKEQGHAFLPIRIGIGLNSGPAVVGNMGADQRFDYSVLGDTVNLASRLEGQSKTYGVTILLGEDCARRAPGFATLPLDLIKVKGKSQAVAVHALIGDESVAQNPAFIELARLQADFLSAYRAQDWSAARAARLAARAAGQAWSLSALYDLYGARIDDYEAVPPAADWDGVFVATTK
jgi:adenylate cyclase